MGTKVEQENGSEKLAPKPVLGLTTATLIVVANMIGSGIFGLTGQLAEEIPSHFAILASWCIGGFMAICGALAYGELASRIPRSGGEYHFLSVLYSPALGFISGFVSIVVGFGAAIALNAGFFAEYLTKVFPLAPSNIIALILIFALTILHALHTKAGAIAQNLFTIVKASLILIFIIAGLFFAPSGTTQEVALSPQTGDWAMLFSPAFAISLISVFYAYLGWNASVYITGEIREPHKNVPRSLLLGTGIVMLLYLLLNFVFLRTVPLELMSGKIEVGKLSAAALFGETVGNALAIIIALALVSSTSSMVMAGPRVTEMMGRDYFAFKALAARKSGGGPWLALLLQAAIASFMILTASYFFILSYIGFTLSIFSTLTVIGVYLARKKGEIPSNKIVKALGYPITPAIFILLSAWMVIHTLYQKPEVALWGLGTFAAGYVFYLLTKKYSNVSK